MCSILEAWICVIPCTCMCRGVKISDKVKCGSYHMNRIFITKIERMRKMNGAIQFWWDSILEYIFFCWYPIKKTTIRKKKWTRIKHIRSICEWNNFCTCILWTWTILYKWEAQQKVVFVSILCVHCCRKRNEFFSTITPKGGKITFCDLCGNIQKTTTARYFRLSWIWRERKTAYTAMPLAFILILFTILTVLPIYSNRMEIGRIYVWSRWCGMILTKIKVQFCVTTVWSMKQWKISHRWQCFDDEHRLCMQKIHTDSYDENGLWFF